MLKVISLVLLNLITTTALAGNVIYDKKRHRNIPVAITQIQHGQTCSVTQKCPVAFVSAGYGIAHTQYRFLSEMLSEHGYLVVAIGHELPSDPALSVSGDLYQTRSENWQRGSDTVRFLQNELSKKYTQYNFEKLLLIGHSNGGDISAWLSNEGADFVSNLITFDHRRVPLPRNSTVNVLSIRAGDFPADKGVLPAKDELGAQHICIITIKNAKHNDMADHGPKWLKDEMARYTAEFLLGKKCDSMSGEHVNG